MRNATPMRLFGYPCVAIKTRRPTRRHYFLRINFRPFSFFTRTTRAKINPAYDLISIWWAEDNRCRQPAPLWHCVTLALFINVLIIIIIIIIMCYVPWRRISPGNRWRRSVSTLWCNGAVPQTISRMHDKSYLATSGLFASWIAMAGTTDKLSI